MAISPLFWNNGWSSQLSLSRIALRSLHSSDALCHSPCGGLLMEKKKKKKRLQAFQKCCWRGSDCVLYGTVEPNRSTSCFSPLLSIVKQRQESENIIFFLSENVLLFFFCNHRSI